MKKNNGPQRELAILFVAFIVCLPAVLGFLMRKKYERSVTTSLLLCLILSREGRCW